MSGKTLLWTALFCFFAVAVVKVFKTDTSNPNSVLERYLDHWKSSNTSGMYPLISQRAKGELKREKVNNVSDYYAYIIEKQIDLSGYEMVSQELKEGNGRYWVQLQLLDVLGRENTENATFYLVKEPDGWRVDGWQWAGSYRLP